MSARISHRPPAAHGDFLITPPFVEWAALVRANAAAAEHWPVELLAERVTARAEIIRAAEEYSRLIGLPPAPIRDGAPVALSGHQPEFVHPGVWIKTFLLERLARETDATAINLVVDTDAAGGVAFHAPCFAPTPSVCEIPLAERAPGATWVQSPIPDAGQREAFRRRGLAALDALQAPGLAQRFADFTDALEDAAPYAGDLGMLLTMARRRYEATAETTYRELPVSVLARTSAFRRFAVRIMLDAAGFRVAMNTALDAYRVSSRTRSAAQPFPDLAEVDGRAEVPFWLLRDGERVPVRVDRSGCLFADGEPLIRLAGPVGEAASAVADADLLLAPRALALTLFARLLLGDLFIHGTGGGRYDRITDAVIETYYGVPAPAYCVASMSLLLPLGVAETTEDDVAAAERRLKRLEHNPDEFIGQAAFLGDGERRELLDLVERKAGLVAALGTPDADRKALGLEVRAVNSALGQALLPLERDLRADLERVSAERAAWMVAGDRTYPFFLWDPREVQALVW